MASIRQQGDAFEIRECRSTASGPRQFVLARFKRVLTPEVLDAARARARRPFDAARLVARARARAIPVSAQRRSSAARALLAELRAGAVLEPTIAWLLRDALAHSESRPLPDHLADAAEWLGQPAVARGRALRGLLRSASRALHSRGPVRELPPEPFPRFDSGAPFAARAEARAAR